MKAGYDARIRLKAEKDEERRRVEDERRRDEELRQNDFPRWLQGLREQHEVRCFLPWLDVLQPVKKKEAKIIRSDVKPAGHHRKDQGAEEAQGAARGSKVARGAEPHEVNRRTCGGRKGGSETETYRARRRVWAERCRLGGVPRDCASLMDCSFFTDLERAAVDFLPFSSGHR